METTMWLIVSVATPTLLALGWGAMQMIDAGHTEFRIARVCFWAAGVMPILATVYSLTQMKAPVLQRMGIGCIAAIVIGLGEVCLLKWVTERERRVQSAAVRDRQVASLTEAPRLKVECNQADFSMNTWESGPVRFLHA